MQNTRPSDHTAAILAEQALSLGLSPDVASSFCITNLCWGVLEKCFDYGQQADQPLSSGETIFVSLCRMDTPIKILEHHFRRLNVDQMGYGDLLRTLSDWQGRSALAVAAASELSVSSFEWLLETLLGLGIDINQENVLGETALYHLSAVYSRYRTQAGTALAAPKARMLLAKGATLERSGIRESPLALASGPILLEMVKLFLEGKIDLTAHLFEYQDPLLHRICLCDLNSQRLSDRTPMNTVPAALKMLLSNCGDRILELLQQKYMGMGILEQCLLMDQQHIDPFPGSWDLHCAERVRVLLDSIADNNARRDFVNSLDSIQGLPPLHRAGQSSFLHTMQELIRAGADVNARPQGDSVLGIVLAHYRYGRGILQIFRLLINSGCDPTQPSTILGEMVPIHAVLQYLSTRGEIAIDSDDSSDDGNDVLLWQTGKRRKRRSKSNKVISVESDYDSDSGQVDSVHEEELVYEVEENDALEWSFEDDMVQIAHLLILCSPPRLLNTPFARDRVNIMPMSCLGDMSDRGESSAAVALFHDMLEHGLDLALPEHKQILQQWRKKRSRINLLSAIAKYRKAPKHTNESRPGSTSRGLFGAPADQDDDGFQHWL